MLSMLLAACNSNSGQDGKSSSEGEGNQNNDGGDKSGLELGEKDIALATDTYVSNTGNTYIMKQLLEEIGYRVTVNQTDVGVEYSGLATGDSDASVASWLPYTHADYWKEYKDKLEKISLVTENVELALTVPSYMEDINSIEDLANNKNHIGEKLEWEITGISPGAGMMKVTENEVIPGYGLDEWELVSSSGPAMAAALSKAIDKEEPIVVTLWTPHWTFNKFDLKMLKDPKNKYGDPDNIYSIARKGFKEDSPAAYKLISQFNITKEDTQTTMLDLQDGMDPDKVAQKFIKNNPDLKEKWMQGINISK